MKIKYPLEDVYTLSVAEILKSFQTDAVLGLNAFEANKRTNEFGFNIYVAQKQKSIWFSITSSDHHKWSTNVV